MRGDPGDHSEEVEISILEIREDTRERQVERGRWRD